jgi:hypothetical protein
LLALLTLPLRLWLVLLPRLPTPPARLLPMPLRPSRSNPAPLDMNKPPAGGLLL